MKVRVYSYYDDGLQMDAIADPKLWVRYENFVDERKMVEFSFIELDVNNFSTSADEELSEDLAGIGY